MKWKKVMAVSLAVLMSVSVAACGGTSTSSGGNTSSGQSSSSLSYANIQLGQDGKDITTTIKLLTNRTDMLKDDYAGTSLPTYVKNFNEMYPNITVTVEGVTDYEQDALLRLQGGDWGDIMMIPAVDKKDLSTYFLSYGDLDTMKQQVNYATKWDYDNQVYGIASTAVGRGIVYNKKVFSDAGITSLPKTPGWTMGAWDDYIGATATGDGKYMNQTLLHTAAPFNDTGDTTHAYNVYKILYDAVSKGLTEDDYTTTDWESSKGMMNNGKIGCMVLGSWAYSQMQAAGPNKDDIGYMPFPISVNGKQYSAASPDYCYGINASASADNQKAAMIFVKWMTEKSGFSYNEGGLPIKAGESKYPDVYQSFIDNNVQFVEDEPAVQGEEDLLNKLNSDSELMITAGGNDKIQGLVEHAANKDESFTDIMNEWNKKWSDAQKADGVTAK